jgi:hypothetical protein
MFSEEDQLDLFPRATEGDIRKAKRLLEKYKWAKRMCSVLEEGDVDSLHPKQQTFYRHWRQIVLDLDRAVKIILDPEVQEVLQYRYIEGHPYHLTVQHFIKKPMDDRTVDRKLNKGIESIAETLLLLQE